MRTVYILAAILLIDVFDLVVRPDPLLSPALTRTIIAILTAVAIAIILAGLKSNNGASRMEIDLSPNMLYSLG